MRKKNNPIVITTRISQEILDMTKVMKTKYCINISELVRSSIKQKFKDLESK